MRVVGINLISIRSNRLSGIGYFAKRYFMEMARLDLSEFHFIIYKQRSVDEAVFCFPENASYEIVNVPDVGGGMKLALFEQILFYFYMKKCDVMWSPNYSSPWFGRRKKIITIHDIYPIIDSKTYKTWKRFWANFLIKINARLSSTIITVSECSKKDIMDIIGIQSSKIRLFYNFLPTSEIAEIKKNKPSESITISGNVRTINKPYFLAVSVIKPIKNYEGLIQAFSVFKKKHPEYSLYIVGSKGWGYRKVFELVESFHLENCICFTGYLSSDDINSLYYNCQATVLPSFYEGFGYTPLEGFYRNKITVASHISSIPEVVGNAGFYINPYDINSIVEGLEKCTGDITCQEKQIEIQISKFNATKIASDFLSLLNE